MTTPGGVIQDPEDISPSVCRGCLQDKGELKNMIRCGLDNDFFKFTEVPRQPTEGMPMLICIDCEEDLGRLRNFKAKCQESDKTLKENHQAKIKHTHSIEDKNHVSSVLYENKLVYMITAPNTGDKICMQCPFATCKATFNKKMYVNIHLKRFHKVSENFEIELQYYCTEKECSYNMNSNLNKFFSERKFLNQHTNKIHKDRIYVCQTCHQNFSLAPDYYRHLKTCNIVFICAICKMQYNTHEAYLVHLMRKHPVYHAKYKQEKKAQKRLADSKGTLQTGDTADVSMPKRPKSDDELDDPEETDVEEESDDEDSDSTVDDKDTDFLLDETETEMPHDVPTEPEPVKITRFPPWQLNINQVNPSPPIDLANSESIPETGETIDVEAQETDEYLTEEVVEEFNEEIITENYMQEEIIDNETIGNQECLDNNIELGPIVEEPANVADYPGFDIDNLKKSSATQFPENIGIHDVTLPSWANKNDFETQRDEMSTQTVFEDYLSIKSQQSEDDMFLSESVSLSDIQTQTLPLEFGLSRSNKQTQYCTSETQSPDLSIKETQTCYCLYDSPKPNYRLFDSLSGSPGSANFISTETQTGDALSPVRSDVLLSFSSAETQTCFDDSSAGSL